MSRNGARCLAEQNVDILSLDLSDNFSLTSPTHSVLFYKNVLIFFPDSVVGFPNFQFHSLLTNTNLLIITNILKNIPICLEQSVFF